MAIAPSTQTHDIDRFQDRQGEFIDAATPDELTDAMLRFCQWVENREPASSDQFDFVNNGTALTLACASELKNRLEKAQAAHSQAQADLVLLTSYLAEHGAEAKDIAYAVEKPWKYVAELAEAKQEVQS